MRNHPPEQHLLVISADGEPLTSAILDHSLLWSFRVTELTGRAEDGCAVLVEQLMAQVTEVFRTDPFMGVVLDLPSFEAVPATNGSVSAAGEGCGFYVARQLIGTLMKLRAERTAVVLLGRGSIEGDVPQELTAALIALDTPHPQDAGMRDLLQVQEAVGLGTLSLEAVVYSLSGWASGLLMSGSRVNLLLLPDGSPEALGPFMRVLAPCPGALEYMGYVGELVGIFVHPVTTLLNGQALVADAGQSAFAEQLAVLAGRGLSLPIT